MSREDSILRISFPHFFLLYIRLQRLPGERAKTIDFQRLTRSNVFSLYPNERGLGQRQYVG